MRAPGIARSGALIRLGLALVMALPVALAATSPYLSSRNPAYVVGGFAGIVGLALFVVQPLLGAGLVRGLNPARQRRWHRRVGMAIVLAVMLHIGGLYLTSPPDTLDALLLVSPTPFSVYGVTALWGVVLTAALAVFRDTLGLRLSTWRIAHAGLAVVVVAATVIHALQIEGTMEPVSKGLLCLAALAATGFAVLRLSARR